jgi:hypothetical protein
MDWVAFCMTLYLNCSAGYCDTSCQTYALNQCEFHYPVIEPEPPPEPEPEPDPEPVPCKGGTKKCGDGGGTGSGKGRGKVK